MNDSIVPSLTEAYDMSDTVFAQFHYFLLQQLSLALRRSSLAVFLVERFLGGFWGEFTVTLTLPPKRKEGEIEWGAK